MKDWDGVKHNRWVLDKVLDRRENCNAEEEGSVGIDCDSPLTTWTLAPWYGDPAPPVYASLLEFKIPAESMYASSGKSSPTDLKMGSVVLTAIAVYQIVLWRRKRWWTSESTTDAERSEFAHEMMEDVFEVADEDDDGKLTVGQALGVARRVGHAEGSLEHDLVVEMHRIRHVDLPPELEQKKKKKKTPSKT